MNQKLCLDCKKDTVEMLEYYMVSNQLWKSLVPEVEGMLCIGCLEKRLKRKLDMSDFMLCPLNLHCMFGKTKCSKRLRSRLSDNGRVTLVVDITY